MELGFVDSAMRQSIVANQERRVTSRKLGRTFPNRRYYYKAYYEATRTPHPKKPIDLTDKKIGDLTVIKKTSEGRWLCECVCGKKVEIIQHSLTRKRRNTKSCGCKSSSLKESRKKEYRYTQTDGYVRVKKYGHPDADSHGYIFEHLIVMEQKIGRRIHDDESVHHKNGIRHDNRPDNLELWSKKHPAGQRVEDMISFCVEYLRFYAPEKLGKDKHALPNSEEL